MDGVGLLPVIVRLLTAGGRWAGAVLKIDKIGVGMAETGVRIFIAGFGFVVVGVGNSAIGGRVLRGNEKSLIMNNY